MNNIQYFGRDFDSLKQFVNNIIKSRFPDTYKDFHEASTGMMLIELTSMIGDILGHYIDYNVGELLDDRVKEFKDAVSVAKLLGYKAKVPSPAVGYEQFYIEVPSIYNDAGEAIPDDRYSLVLKATSKVASEDGGIFELIEDIDFSKGVNVEGLDIENLNVNQREIVPSQYNADGEIIYFAIRKTGQISAGLTKEYAITLPNEFVQFREITLPDKDISEIIEVSDSENELWYEVNYLAQEVVFAGIPNVDDDSSLVPHLLKFRTVPKRFVTDYDPTTFVTKLVFGSGKEISESSYITLSPQNYIWSQMFSPTAIMALDPQTFSSSPTLGLSPYNTTLTIKYRQGGGVSTNVGSINSISSVTEKLYEIASTSISASALSAVINSISATNTQPISGGTDAETIEELLERAKANFATQERVVTKEDYLARLYSMSAKYGSVFRAIIADDTENSEINIYALTLDSSNDLMLPTDNLKDNIKTYLGYFKLMTERINITDGIIINLGLDYSIVADPKKSKHKILSNCGLAIKEYFNIKNWNFGQPIMISEIISLLHEIDGVVAVSSVDFKNIKDATGENYSSNSFDIKNNIKDNIILCPKYSIFEIKYPDVDITGVAL